MDMSRATKVTTDTTETMAKTKIVGVNARVYPLIRPRRKTLRKSAMQPFAHWKERFFAETGPKQPVNLLGKKIVS